MGARVRSPVASSRRGPRKRNRIGYIGSTAAEFDEDRCFKRMPVLDLALLSNTGIKPGPGGVDFSRVDLPPLFRVGRHRHPMHQIGILEMIQKCVKRLPAHPNALALEIIRELCHAEATGWSTYGAGCCRYGLSLYRKQRP